MSYDPAGFIRTLIGGTVMQAGKAVQWAGQQLLNVYPAPPSPPAPPGGTGTPPGVSGGSGGAPVGSSGSHGPGQLWYTAPLNGQCDSGYHLETINVGSANGDPFGVPLFIYVCVQNGHHYPGPSGGSSGGVV